MIFEPISLAGACLVLPKRRHDQRGFFARTFCREKFREQGLEDCSLQCSVSFNPVAGTLRGLHFQREPHEEAKLIRCSRGAVFDVIVDIRPGSDTFGQWAGAELTEQNGHALYVPRGFAHGYMTMRDATEVYYQMAGSHVPSAAAGLRWDDPSLGIEWPAAPKLMSQKDRELPWFADLFEQAPNLPGRRN